MIKQLGFNAFRVHMKVESRRFYHHADRLGIMILQDMPRCAMGECSNGRLDCCARLRLLLRTVTGRSGRWFGLELQAMVTNLRNHPSVVQYQIFNEGGGGDGSCSFVCEQLQRVRAQPKDLLSRRIIGKCSRSLCLLFRRSSSSGCTDISGGGTQCMCPLSRDLCACPGRSASCPALNWTGHGCGCGCAGVAGWDAHQYPLPNAPLANASMIACADE